MRAGPAGPSTPRLRAGLLRAEQALFEALRLLPQAYLALAVLVAGPSAFGGSLLGYLGTVTGMAACNAVNGLRAKELFAGLLPVAAGTPAAAKAHAE